jgi:hypothetical protein
VCDGDVKMEGEGEDRKTIAKRTEGNKNGNRTIKKENQKEKR